MIYRYRMEHSTDAIITIGFIWRGIGLTIEIEANVRKVL